MCVCVCTCARVYVLTETPLLDCADELKPWPAVSEGISPLNDTKLQGSTSAQHIHRCLCCFNWIAFGWTAVIRPYILLELRTMNIKKYINSQNRRNTMLPLYLDIAQKPQLINLLFPRSIKDNTETWFKWHRGTQWLIPKCHKASPSITVHLCCTLLL